MRLRLTSTIVLPAILVCLVLLAGNTPHTAAAPVQPQEPEPAALHSSPIMFIENAGQWDDRAKFQVWGGSAGTMWLAEDGIWITVLEDRPRTEDERPEVDLGSPSFVDRPSSRLGANVRLSFPGASPHPRIETFDRLDTTISYFLGNDPDQWRPDVPVWGGVRYVDLWPGVDLEVVSEDGRLVQRFVAQDGADVSAARMMVEGADEVSLQQGWLVLSTQVRDLALYLPQSDFSYGLEAVAADGRVDSLEVQPRTASSAMDAQSVATPGDNPDDLLYSTFLGGGGDDGGYAIAVDGSGSAYVTGQAFSSDFPTTPGAIDTSFNGSQDGFVVKLNPSGSGLAYATFLGGSWNDFGRGIAVDESGRAYVAGGSGSTDFPTTPGAFDTSNNGSIDGFVAKLNPAGSGLAYATLLGGSSLEWIYGIAVDGSGSAYVAGLTPSSDFPTTPGAFDTSFSGGYSDAFVVKLNPAGSGLAYGTFLGGSEKDHARGIAVDGSGSAYVTGQAFSSDFPTTPGAIDTSFNGSQDGFVVKLNPTGSGLAYSTFLGGSAGEWGQGIAVDGAGRAFVTGDTWSSDFPTTQGAFDRSYNSVGADGFVVKLNSTGSGLVYSTFLGGNSGEWSDGIAVDGAGSAYVTGGSPSSDFPTTPGAFDRSFNGGNDAFVVKLNPAGSGLDYGTLLGGGEHDYGGGIAVDGSGSAYVVGDTPSTNFPTTLGAFDTTHNGDSDAFVAKLAMGGTAATPTTTPTATPTHAPTNTPTPTATATRTVQQYCDWGPLSEGWELLPPLDPGLNHTAAEPAFDVDQDGRLYVVWADTYGHNYEVRFTTWDPDTGQTWPERLHYGTRGPDYFSPQIAVTNDGNVHTVWRDFVEGFRLGIQYRSRDGNGNWSDPVQLDAAAGDTQVEPAAMVSGPGDMGIVVTWREKYPDGTYRILLRQRSAEGQWNQLAQVAEGHYAGDLMDDGDVSTLAIAPDGTVHVAWVVTESLSGSPQYWSDTVYYSSSRDGITWSSLEEVDRGATCSLGHSDVDIHMSLLGHATPLVLFTQGPCGGFSSTTRSWQKSEGGAWVDAGVRPYLWGTPFTAVDATGTVYAMSWPTSGTLRDTFRSSCKTSGGFIDDSVPLPSHI